MTESMPTIDGSPGPGLTPGGMLRTDLVLRLLGAALAAIVGSVLLMPLATRAQWSHVGFLALAAIVVVVLLRALRQVEAWRERIFWRLVTLTVGLWSAALVIHLVTADRISRGGSNAIELGLDALVCCAYLSLLLAIEARPDLGDEDGPLDLLDASADLILVAGLFLYFSVLPVLAAPSVVHSTSDSWLLDLVLDILLILRFGFLARAVRPMRPRWGFIYGGLSFFGFLLAVGDLLEVFATPWAANLWWLVPLVWLACLARLSRACFAADGLMPPLRLASPFLLYGFVIPLFHLAIHTTGLVREEQRLARDLVVFAVLLVVGSLALLEYSVLRRRSRELESSRLDAERSARSQSLYLRSLIEHSPVAIVVLDADHRVELSNPAFEALFGYTTEEVAGRTLDALIATRQTAAEAAEYTRKVLAGEPVHKVTRRRRKDGSEVEVEIQGVPLLRDGELVGIYAIYLDVTERRRAEERLRESEERFRRLSDATFEGIVLSRSGVILDCNEQYANLVGLPQSEVVGRDVIEFVAPEERKLIALRIREGFEEPYEHRMISADGEEIVVEVHARSLPSDGYNLRVAAVRDITESKRFEEQVRQTQKMEAVGRLAGGIAHDFNNVLTVIKGYSQLLAFRLDDGAVRDQVEEIQQAADRASLMTQRLLAFGRKQALQPQILDLDQVVRGMEEMLRRLIRADIDLQVSTGADLGRVQADPGQIEQVILNLTINARDAMPRGGTLQILTRNVELERGQAALPAGSYIELEVTDDGVGMDERTRLQVFEPFFTTKSKDEGTGLGLATVYAIVHQNGGSITVESAPDEGASFRLLFPRVPERDQPDEPVRTFGELPRGDETILVVEDEPGVRALAVEFLESQGYRVEQAADGRDGLRRVAELETLDLLLTDVIMPGINGPEMAEQVLRERPETRVLFMSGYTDEALGWHDPEVAARLVQKPFSIEELVIKVREILDA